MASGISETAQIKFNALQEALDAFLTDIGHESQSVQGLDGLPLIKNNSEPGGMQSYVARLDAEIAALHLHCTSVHQQISLRRQSLNMLCSIHKLPNEVLSDIIQMVWKPDHELKSYQSMEQVCIYWRGLTRSAPLVSSLAPHPWNQQMIATSGTSLLTIDCQCVNDPFVERFLRLIEPHSHRWGYFHGKIIGYEDWDHYFIHAAPRLKFFSLELELAIDRFPRVVNLFDGKAPHLTRLEIPQINIPWDSDLLRGLQSLHISATNGTEAVPNSKLRQILEASPNLQQLVLTGDPELQSQYPPFLHDEEEPLNLPHLRILELKEPPAQTIHWALSAIRTPLLGVFYIRIGIPDEHVLLSTFEQLPDDGVLNSTIPTNPGEDIDVILDFNGMGWIACLSLSRTFWHVNWAYEINICCTGQSLAVKNPLIYANRLFPAWVPIASVLSLSDSLYSFPADYGSTVATLEFLCRLVAVKKLAISHTEADQSSILRILGSPVKWTQSSSVVWPCPNLISLDLQGLNWFNLAELLTCLKSRYGITGGGNFEIHGYSLPARLDELTIDTMSYIDEDVDLVLEEIREIVGGDALKITSQGWQIS